MFGEGFYENGNVPLLAVYGDIDAIVALCPEHIATYCLTFEPGTKLYELREMGKVDEAIESYVRALQYLPDDHDAHDVLPQVRCPSLVVAGGQDVVTPVSAVGVGVGAIEAASPVVAPSLQSCGYVVCTNVPKGRNS